MTDYRYEVFLSRIEVIRGENARAKEEDTWRVTVETFKPNVAILTGLFKIATKDGVGRSMAHCVLTMRNGKRLPSAEEVPSIDVFRDCVEAIYDVSRRSLNAQAAMMDFNFDLPIRSSEVEVKIKKKMQNGTKTELANT